ncbi:centrosomal protein kizuna isoform X6 [Columba livia]|uniref:centrosomal protein kizuna isoform X6 n=1 Tax=Columba livia TaxID=8932 RepID=UPI0031BB9365
MSGPGPAPGAAANSAAAAGSCGPGLSPGTIRRRLRHSEAKRLELERKLMEYVQSDAYQIKMKRMKLQKYLKEIEERQKRARVRNQALLKEFDEFEAHLKTSNLEMSQKMEAWYERELKRASSLQEGGSSAAGDEEGAAEEQVPWAGRPLVVSTRAAVSPTGALGTLQKRLQPTESRSAPGLSLCSPSLERLGPHSRSAGLESAASAGGAASCRGLAAGEEGSKQPISSASDPKPAAPEEERPRGSVPGPKPLLSTRWPCEEASGEGSAEPPVPTSTEEVTLRGAASPAAGGERGRAACAAQGPPLHPQTLPSASSVPHSFCPGAGSLKDDDLEAREAAVLHQLRALFPGALNGCLPPEKTLPAGRRAAPEKQTRPHRRSARTGRLCSVPSRLAARRAAQGTAGNGRRRSRRPSWPAAPQSQVTSNEPIIPPALSRAHASFPAGLLAIMAPKQKEAKKCVWKPVLPQMKGALPSQGLKSRRER